MLFGIFDFFVTTVIVFGLFDLKRSGFVYYRVYVVAFLVFVTNQYFAYSLLVHFLLGLGMTFVVIREKLKLKQAFSRV